MIIPKTYLVYSWPYNRELNLALGKERASEEFIALKANSKAFEELYNLHITRILEYIPKLTGYDWEIGELPIYMVFREVGSSFSLPLTLVYNPSEYFMLVTLIHELVHNNIQQPFISAAEREGCINLVVRQVIAKLGLAIESELDKLDEYHKKKYSGYKCPDWNLGSKPLKKWLEEER